MEMQEEQWGSLVRQAEQTERKARQRAVVFSLIPVILAGLLLWFTGHQIQQASRQLAEIQATTQAMQAQRDEVKTQLAQTQTDLTTTRKTLGNTQQTLTDTQARLTTAEQDVKRLQTQLDDLNKSLDEVSKQLRLATDFSKYQFPGDWVDAIKLIESYYPRQGKILFDIYDLREAHWKLHGFSPEEGFDSPSFAAYVLGNKNHLIKDPASNRYQLQDVLPRRSQPELGDVVFYQTGYTMFYFDNGRGNPFVIGMTPLGVLALKPDFATVISYGAIDYQSMR